MVGAHPAVASLCIVPPNLGFASQPFERPQTVSDKRLNCAGQTDSGPESLRCWVIYNMLCLGRYWSDAHSGCLFAHRPPPRRGVMRSVGHCNIDQSQSSGPNLLPKCPPTAPYKQTTQRGTPTLVPSMCGALRCLVCFAWAAGGRSAPRCCLTVQRSPEAKLGFHNFVGRPPTVSDKPPPHLRRTNRHVLRSYVDAEPLSELN